MLSELQVRKAKPREKSYMINDGDGLYIEVVPGGGKYWRLRYWPQGKEKKISLGVYPRVGLKEARDKRDAFKRDLANGIDPRAPKPEIVTFEKLALEWYSKRVEGVKAPSTARVILSRMTAYLFPLLGNCAIKDITPPELLVALRAVEARGTVETAHRVRQIAGKVFRYGVATGVCERNVASDLQDALPPLPKDKHFAALTDPADIAGLIRAVKGYTGSVVVKSAILFSLYTFQRPGEIRRAEWTEIDWNKAEWNIPAQKMKMKREHLVPLSSQVLEILQQLKPITGRGRYVFPAYNSSDGSRPMSSNGVLGALRRLGYTTEELCWHGLRTAASTNLNEQRWPADVIERQLSHVEGNAVRAAYNKAEYLDQRREMMQAWADWLDSLLEVK
jgi:integrase